MLIRLTLAFAIVTTGALAESSKEKRNPAHERVGVALGVGRYVTRNCPGMAIQPRTISIAMMANGLDLSETTKKRVGAIAYAYEDAMAKVEPVVMCEVLWKRFGPDGTVLPDVIYRQQ